MKFLTCLLNFGRLFNLLTVVCVCLASIALGQFTGRNLSRVWGLSSVGNSQTFSGQFVGSSPASINFCQWELSEKFRFPALL